MALAKYAEDNLEIYLERMEKMKQTETADYTPQSHATKTATKQTAQSENSKEYNAFLAMFAEESCFI